MKEFGKSVFLVNEGFGITATCANYLANLAQEVILEKKAGLENISFLSSRIVTPLCPEGLDYEKSNYDLDKISGTIREIGNLNAFCAWVREGIKAKDHAFGELSNHTFEKWIEDNNIEKPEAPVLVEKWHKDFTDELTVGERLRMLRSEAIAAAYGKLIHGDTPISNARKQLLNRMYHATEKTGDGQNLTLVVYSADADVKDVDAVFMKLQNEQREYEKELNSFKFRIEKQVCEHRMISSRRHDQAITAYQSKMDSLRSKYSAYIAEENERISELKIYIPDALMDTYRYLNNLGK